MRLGVPLQAFIFVTFSILASAQNQMLQQDAEIVTDRPDITESSIVVPERKSTERERLDVDGRSWQADVGCFGNSSALWHGKPN
jgi:hypothetical protein